jgi:hypothetical protein
MPADVATFGVISLLRADDDRAVPRPEVAMERVHEKEKPLAISIWAESIDDAASGAGLRLSSTGISGGKARVGERATVATVGKGAVDFDLSAFDDDRGGLGDRRFAQRVTGPDGHLPSELIQRVVRDNFGRFETCYRGGLRRNPTLRGRVVVTFVIDRRGNVALARDDSLPVGLQAMRARLDRCYLRRRKRERQSDDSRSPKPRSFRSAPPDVFDFRASVAGCALGCIPNSV